MILFKDSNVDNMIPACYIINVLLLLFLFPLGERDEPTTFDYVSIAIAASVVRLIAIIVLALFILCCIWYKLCWKTDDVC